MRGVVGTAARVFEALKLHGIRLISMFWWFVVVIEKHNNSAKMISQASSESAICLVLVNQKQRMTFFLTLLLGCKRCCCCSERNFERIRIGGDNFVFVLFWLSILFDLFIIFVSSYELVLSIRFQRSIIWYQWLFCSFFFNKHSNMLFSKKKVDCCARWRRHESKKTKTKTLCFLFVIK